MWVKHKTFQHYCEQPLQRVSQQQGKCFFARHHQMPTPVIRNEAHVGAGFGDCVTQSSVLKCFRIIPRNEDWLLVRHWEG